MLGHCHTSASLTRRILIATFPHKPTHPLAVRSLLYSMRRLASFLEWAHMRAETACLELEHLGGE